mmetsp:Transcript_20735/g.24715  ORF Transcript_20735/g.24715 Transcript_20735/m.24715 type:complete len:91 (-) Transcript_20735:67-339(-)
MEFHSTRLKKRLLSSKNVHVHWKCSVTSIKLEFVKQAFETNRVPIIDVLTLRNDEETELTVGNILSGSKFSLTKIESKPLLLPSLKTQNI